MRRAYRESEKGFTLVEMSIVLVIIGLIVSGVLVGQDLIAAAKNRATIQQIQQYDVAINSFVLKFNEAPGDLSRAEDFLGTAAAANGDGNGRIDQATGGTTPSAMDGEIDYFWNHLGLSGMVGATFTSIGGDITSGDNVPLTETGRGFVVGFYSGGRAGHHWYIGGGDGTNDTLVGDFFGTESGLQPAEAFAIDGKLDDGNATTGIVRVVNPTSAATINDPDSFPPQAGGDDVCWVNGSTEGIYALINEDPECNLAINMSGI